jgi:hypothetical protein
MGWIDGSIRVDLQPGGEFDPLQHLGIWMTSEASAVSSSLQYRSNVCSNQLVTNLAPNFHVPKNNGGKFAYSSNQRAMTSA